jgi:transcriptional regulator with XRE-family HTH domain
MFLRLFYFQWPSIDVVIRLENQSGEYMNRLKLWRIQNRHTQLEAATLLHMGLSTYCLLESGRLQPTGAQLKQLREYFGASESSRLFELVAEKVEIARD